MYNGSYCYLLKLLPLSNSKMLFQIFFIGRCNCLVAGKKNAMVNISPQEQDPVAEITGITPLTHGCMAPIQISGSTTLSNLARQSLGGAGSATPPLQQHHQRSLSLPSMGDAGRGTPPLQQYHQRSLSLPSMGDAGRGTPPLQQHHQWSLSLPAIGGTAIAL